jgi:hypothetical protein
VSTDVDDTQWLALDALDEQIEHIRSTMLGSGPVAAVLREATPHVSPEGGAAPPGPAPPSTLRRTPAAQWAVLRGALPPPEFSTSAVPAYGWTVLPAPLPVLVSGGQGRPAPTAASALAVHPAGMPSTRPHTAGGEVERTGGSRDEARRVPSSPVKTPRGGEGGANGRSRPPGAGLENPYEAPELAGSALRHFLGLCALVVGAVGLCALTLIGLGEAAWNWWTTH